MKNRMVLILFVIIIIVFGITSCRYNTTHDELDYLKLSAYVSIPCLIDDNLKDYNIGILERDDYGRILYSVEVKTKYNDIDAVVIIQDYDDNSVMFYEDVSYYLGKEDIEQIKFLKENNDWNKELKYGNITKRNAYFCLNGDAFGVCFGIYPESKCYSNIYETDMKLKKELSANSIESVRTDYDENGKWLMYCVAEFDNKSEIVIAIYENNTVIGYEIIDNIANIGNSVRNLKERTDWNYNYYSE